MPLPSPAATTSFSHFSFRKPPLNNNASENGLELTPLTFHHFSVFLKGMISHSFFRQGTNIPSPKCGRRRKSSSWPLMPLRHGKTLAELKANHGLLTMEIGLVENSWGTQNLPTLRMIGPPMRSLNLNRKDPGLQNTLTSEGSKFFPT